MWLISANRTVSMMLNIWGGPPHQQGPSQPPQWHFKVYCLKCATRFLKQSPLLSKEAKKKKSVKLKYFYIALISY